jgi:hypothetical protein
MGSPLAPTFGIWLVALFLQSMYGPWMCTLLLLTLFQIVWNGAHSSLFVRPRQPLQAHAKDMTDTSSGTTWMAGGSKERYGNTAPLLVYILTIYR